MTLHEDPESRFDFLKAWFIVVALLAMGMILGGAYVVFLLLGHFGVIA